MQFTGVTDSVPTIAFSPDGNMLVGGMRDNTIRLWDGHTGKNLRTIKGYTNWARSVAFSPDGRTIINGSWGKTFYLLDTDIGKNLRTFTGHTEKIWSVAFSSDGKTIASGGHDKTVCLWDVRIQENYSELSQGILLLSGALRSVLMEGLSQVPVFTMPSICGMRTPDNSSEHSQGIIGWVLSEKWWRSVLMERLSQVPVGVKSVYGM